MIKSYRNKGLRRFAEKGDARKLPVQNADRVRRILALLDQAKVPGDMDQAGLDYHHNKHWGRYAVKVTGNWRVTWAWTDGHATDVDIEDYH